MPAYAFGEKGNEQFGIPPNATVEYTVTLIEFERVNFYIRNCKLTYYNDN